MTSEEMFRQLFGKEPEKIDLDELPCEIRIMAKIFRTILLMLECHAVALFDVLQHHGGLPLSEEFKELMNDYFKAFNTASQIKFKNVFDEWYKSHHSGN